MPDTVITLRAVAVKLASAAMDAKLIYAAIAEAPPVVVPVVKFAMRISSQASQGQCRLRLWDAFGRKPLIVGTDWDFYGRTDLVVPLEKPPAEVHGHTLTWSVRLAPFEPEGGERYELLAQILQDGAVLPNANFSYSGPLDDFEELSGRFHFVVEKPVQPALAIRPGTT